MAGTNFVLVYTTVPTRSIGKKIMRALIDAKLAACGNMIGPTESMYRWKGNIEETKEFIVLLKTTKARFEQVKKKIVELHPYECPCVIRIAIDGGNNAYLDWIRETVNS